MRLQKDVTIVIDLCWGCTQNKRRVVVALTSVISAYGSRDEGSATRTPLGQNQGYTNSG